MNDALTSSRRALHRVAAHVLGRRRYQVAARFGLRAAPGGFATPAFGDGPEVLRLSGTTLIRERGGEASFSTVAGASLRSLAAFCDADLEADFSSGADTPPIGDPDATIEIVGDAVSTLADWLALGWRVLDQTVIALGPSSTPATIQLWPEHFDAGTNVAVRGGARVNLGFSLGDEGIEEPYAYLGPWGSDRPGDPSYWNAPFGAVLRLSELGDDRASECLSFFGRGLRAVAGG